MSVQWNGNAIHEIEDASAKGLLRAAVYVQTHLMQRLNKPYPPASKPGQYPAKRTGHGQAGVLYEPESIDEVARRQAVKIGYVENVFYMGILEAFKERLGLVKTMKDLGDQIDILATAK